MKYLLYTGDNYSQLGGAEDFRGMFDSLDEAKAQVSSPKYEWAHITTLDAPGTIVAECLERSGCGWVA